MTIRDLGYRPYEGQRLPASNNTWVMLRQGLARAWASWLVKIAVFVGWAPALITIAIVAVMRLAVRGPDGALIELSPTMVLRNFFIAQTWLFVSLVTLGAGASAIAEDMTFKAFPFYFSKPVTPVQYLVGRVLAVAVFVFSVTYVPSVFVNATLAATAPAEVALDEIALLLPSLVFCLSLSLVMASVSVAVSALSPSRALTMSAWIVWFVVPHVIGMLVDAIARAAGEEDGWPWLFLVSFTSLLGVVADALFKIETQSQLHWYYAVPVLMVFVAASLFGAHERVRRAEVFA